jgi:hypothetical protein
MSEVPTQPTAKQSSRGLIFIAPLVLLVASVLDTLLLWHGNLSVVDWVLTIATLATCVLGLVTAFSKGSSFMLLRAAGIAYGVITLGWNIFDVLTKTSGGSFLGRFCIVFGLPFSPFWFTPFYSYGFHIAALVVLRLLTSLSIVLIPLLSLIVGNSKPVILNFPPVSHPATPTPTNGLRMTTNNQSNGQWLVKMPGQPDNAVDTSTLQMWSRSGVIRPDTLIVEVSTGMSYQAGQIPGVFSSKSYVTALLLSFFVGYLGIDRFYLGQTGLGIGKLLTLGGCGVWALIDFILIAMRKVTDSQGNPLV